MYRTHNVQKKVVIPSGVVPCGSMCWYKYVRAMWRESIIVNAMICVNSC